MRSVVVIFLSLVNFLPAFAQRKIDVTKYRFHLTVNDQNDTIRGKAEIFFTIKEHSSRIELDLFLANGQGKGMIIDDVVPASYTTSEKNQKLNIDLGKIYDRGDTAKVVVFYHGVPKDGLIISKNKFGRRTFFADNWPDRAHHWIPCVDDPSDKAAVEFIVTSPSHYQVVSNGVLKEKTNITPQETLTHWTEDEPLPTKIMVIGIAGFAVNYSETKRGLPVSSWVFPENKDKGFYDYHQAVEVLEFFEDYIGPFPYRKLANVQSKTIFGGMENAGAIFYAENSVTGNRSSERLIAHEIVHQWFGDNVTEKAFSHLWLSEGFATYLAQVYMEHKYGRKKLQAQMEIDRKQVLAFARSAKTPVVDSVSTLMDLLNANSYQKGGWILHMLRSEIGEDKFRQVIREYNKSFSGKNAETSDLREIAERISGRKLDFFFKQWVFGRENPTLSIEWKHDNKTNSLFYTIRQEQDQLFHFTLQINVTNKSGKTVLHELKMDQKEQTFEFPYSGEVDKVEVDPNVNLLGTWKIVRGN